MEKGSGIYEGLGERGIDMLALIVAYAKNRVIGKDGRIPWHIPGEQERFRELTMGNLVVMGRCTYEEIGHPLPRRTNIVVSGTRNYDEEGCITVHSLGEAIKFAGDRKLYVAGGERLYKEALPLVEKMYITEVSLEVEGDRFFPEFDATDFEKKVERKVDGVIGYSYLTYVRKNICILKNL